MLSDKYLEGLGAAIYSTLNVKDYDDEKGLMLGKLVQNIYTRLMQEQERDERDFHNGKH